ncbi:MAG: RNA polymerase sigma factor, partial [Myxococcota bacterium]
RHASGDLTAFQELMRHYGKAVMGYVVRCGVPPAMRDDVFQDVFFKIHRNAPLYSPRHPLRPWLFTVTANVVRSHFRKQGVFKRYFSAREIEQDPTDPSPSCQAAGEGQEVALRLDRSIQKLPMKQREVLCLVCLEGMALDEVAVALSMPVNSVKTNLQRARKTLRKDLERYEKTMMRELTR